MPSEHAHVGFGCILGERKQVLVISFISVTAALGERSLYENHAEYTPPEHSGTLARTTFATLLRNDIDTEGSACI